MKRIVPRNYGNISVEKGNAISSFVRMVTEGREINVPNLDRYAEILKNVPDLEKYNMRVMWITFRVASANGGIENFLETLEEIFSNSVSRNEIATMAAFLFPLNLDRSKNLEESSREAIRDIVFSELILSARII